MEVKTLPTEEFEKRCRAKQISGAVFDLAAHLTGQKFNGLTNGYLDAAEVLHHLGNWAKDRGLDLNEANVKTWEDQL